MLDECPIFDYFCMWDKFAILDLLYFRLVCYVSIPQYSSYHSIVRKFVFDTFSIIRKVNKSHGIFTTLDRVDVGLLKANKYVRSDCSMDICDTTFKSCCFFS